MIQRQPADELARILLTRLRTLGDRYRCELRGNSIYGTWHIIIRRNEAIIYENNGDTLWKRLLFALEYLEKLV